MNILYRANDTVESVNGKRAFGTKKKVLFFCYESLVKNIRSYSKENIDLHIFYDSLSKESIDFFDSFEDIKKTYHHVIPGGNNKTFEACYNFSLDLDGPIFFLEDDYYLEENCLNILYDFYYAVKDNLSIPHFCINPMEDLNLKLDSPDIYNNSLIKYQGHLWRQTLHTTNTFIVDKFILLQCKDCYQNWINFYKINPKYNENNTRNNVYKKFKCFSPTPTLVEHLQTFETLSACSVFNNLKYTPTLSLQDCIKKNIGINFKYDVMLTDVQINDAKLWNNLVCLQRSQNSENRRLSKILKKIFIYLPWIYYKIIKVFYLFYRPFKRNKEL